MADATNSSPSANPSLEELHHFTLDILEKLERRLTKLEELIQDRDSENTEKPAFPQFKRLPPEIRRQIWSLTLTRRKLRPWHCNEEFERTNRGLTPPITSRVCRESRAVACQHGTMFQLYWTRPWYQAASTSSYWTWFDGSRDILELHTCCLPGTEYEPQGLMKMLRTARFILIKTTHISSQWVAHMFSNLRANNSLRTIYLQRTRCEAAHRFRWSPEALKTVFAHDEIHLLNLENEDEVEDMQRLQALNPERQEDCFNIWLKTWKEKERRPWDKHTSAWAKELLEYNWVKAINSVLVEGPEGEGFEPKLNKSDHRVQRILKDMPRMISVYAIELSSLDDKLDGDEYPLRHPVYEIDFYKGFPNILHFED